MKTGGVYLGFHTFRGRKFPYGNFRTSVFCKVKTQIVGKTKFFDSLSTVLYVRCFFICRRNFAHGRAVLQRMPKEKVTDTLRVSGRHVSVDAPFSDGEDNSLLDVLVNSDSPIADRGLINESLGTEVERALSTLTDRERDIIKYFFGIGCSEMTLEEIGEKFGLTRERVRQIKEKAIRRLRHSTRSKLLKSYLG